MSEMVQGHFSNWEAPIEQLWVRNGCEVCIKRDDQIDPLVSGNKLYKLKENLRLFHEGAYKTLITFGGAYSNHIAATASICQKEGISCVGFIRGEPTSPLNTTLQRAQAQGMTLKYINRSDYRKRDEPNFIREWISGFERPYIIPEGGANKAGIEGAKAMLGKRTEHFSHIVSAVGTGTTLAGLALNASAGQRIVGLVIHRYLDVIIDLLPMHEGLKDVMQKLEVQPAHYGGYAKWDASLLAFIRMIDQTYSIQLDPIYTGKALFTLTQFIDEGYFPQGSKVLFIHTGGLQGIAGFEQRWRQSLFRPSGKA